MIREILRLTRCLTAAVLIAAAVLLGIVPAVLALVALVLLAIPCVVVCMAGGAIGVLLGRSALWILPRRDTIEARDNHAQLDPDEDFRTNWGNPYLSKL